MGLKSRSFVYWTLYFDFMKTNESDPLLVNKIIFNAFLESCSILKQYPFCSKFCSDQKATNTVNA